ncbi:17634_t:CDS:2 [Funneliformis geosporum]|nr:17634_t:CDS:2 [Funneliformis geosporum]
MEYADGGSLENYLKNNFNRLEWVNKCLLAFQLTSAVSCLHGQGIVHSNLHSGNILIHQGSIKLADFGLSNGMKRPLNLIPYTDPKLFKLRNNETTSLDYKSDVYSVGVLLWEISSGRRPFYFEGIPYDMDLVIIIAKGLRETIIPGTPEGYAKIYSGKYINMNNMF